MLRITLCVQIFYFYLEYLTDFCYFSVFCKIDCNFSLTEFKLFEVNCFYLRHVFLTYEPSFKIIVVLCRVLISEPVPVVGANWLLEVRSNIFLMFSKTFIISRDTS